MKNKTFGTKKRQLRDFPAYIFLSDFLHP